VISPVDNRLTPDAVQGVAFPSARIGRRGLDEEHVRAFCAQVERELVKLLNERASLTAEVHRLRRRVLGLSGSEGGLESPRSDANQQAVRILSEAQQIADRYVADAQAYSARLAAEAQRRRDEMLAEARSRAEVLIEQAHQAIRYPPPGSGHGGQ
jgi:DivIVA domain-containing protein